MRIIETTTYANADERNSAINSGIYDGKHIVAEGDGINTPLTVSVVEE